MSSRDSLLPSAQGCSLRESLRKQKGVKISLLGFSLVLWQPSLAGRVTRSAKGGEKKMREDLAGHIAGTPRANFDVQLL